MRVKKAVLLAGFMIWTGAFCEAQHVADDFDWGTGVSGRTAVTAGQSINGLAAQSGTVNTWATSGDAKFSGTSGLGNGLLDLSGNNATIKIDYAPAGGWSGDKVIAAVQANYASGTGAVKGLYAGFQVAVPDNGLINNQKTDKIYGQISSAGNVVLKSIIAGETNNSAAINLGWAQGDLVKMALTVDAANKTATLITTDLTQSLSATNTISWITAATPGWAVFTVQQTGYSTAVLDSVGAGIASPARSLQLLGITSP